MPSFRKITNLFHKSHNLKQAVSVLFVTVLISNVLGLIRNIIIANRVGVTYGSIAPLDTYYAAFTLPDFLYNILIVGALSSAILPLLVRLDTENTENEFWRIFNLLLSTGITAILVGLIVLFIFLPRLMPHLFPGFTPANLHTATSLAQVMLLSPLFFTVSQLSTSALQAKKLFFAPAVAPIVYNLAIITAALLVPFFGLSVLAVGIISGAALHFLIQLPSLLKVGWKFKFQTGFKNSYVRNVVKVMLPRTIALTSTQLLLIAFYQIASKFKGGAITIYTLTDDLQTAPVLLLANSLAMAILPDFTRHFAKEEHSEFQTLVGKAVRLLWYIFLPVTAFLIIYRLPIMSIYIAVGHSISHAQTALAAQTFSYFVVSLFFQGLVLLLARAFFAQSDTVRPTVISVASILSAWLIAEILAAVTHLDVAGLAVAFSCGSFLNAFLLWLALKLPLRTMFVDSNNNKLNFILVTLGGLVTGGLFYLIKRLILNFSANLPVSPSEVNLLSILLGLLFGGLFYLLWSWVFNLEQWQLIKIDKTSTTR